MPLGIFMHTRNHRVMLAHAVANSSNKICHLPPVLVGVLYLVEIVILILVCRLCWFPDRLSVCVCVFYPDKQDHLGYLKTVLRWWLIGYHMFWLLEIHLCWDVTHV